MRSIPGAEALSDSEVDFLQNVALKQFAAFESRPAGVWSQPAVRQREPPEVINNLVGIPVGVQLPGTGAGPLMSIERLASELQSDVARVKWIEQARVEAIVGGCRASLRSVQSGIRCYVTFAERVLQKSGPKLPPTTDEILSWSLMFRCEGTFSNYVVGISCMLDGVPTDAFSDPVVKRARCAIRKRRTFIPRP